MRLKLIRGVLQSKGTPALLLFLLVFGCSSRRDSINPPPEYQSVVAKLREVVQYEMEDKGLPSFAMVLVDDQEILWAEGFGLENPETGKRATMHTVYRVGSVSKLFTDMGVMQMVEKGKINLDAPITDYLPEFQPRNRFGRQVTLRQLMSHRSGLLREPLVGNYFDDTEPSLAVTVASAANSDLIYEPESRIKYSNAGIAVVGYTLERMSGKPFAAYLKEKVLEPMGLKASAFEPTGWVRKNLASALMWSYDGREYAAPTFELGMAPAGSMYAPITDLGKFMKVMFNGGGGPAGEVLKSETLEEMWTPQFGSGPNQGYGIGFGISEQSGHKRVGHGGAIYGFATQLYMLPHEKLGVAAATSMDVSNSVTRRIAVYALDLMLAANGGEPLPDFPHTAPVDSSLAGSLDGTYESESETVKIVERYGELTLHRRFIQSRLRARGDVLVSDDRLLYGTEIIPGEDGTITVNGIAYEKVPRPKPETIPQRWQGLVGEYGWDHNILFIYEDGGKLHSFIEWFDKYPLEEIDQNTFVFPREGGMYHGERLRFTRNEAGSATQVEIVNGVIFKRREIGTPSGETFRIVPLRPVEELRHIALTSKPPSQPAGLRQPELVELAQVDPTIRLDIRYATTNNFMSTVFYDEPRAFMQRPAADALLRAHRRLRSEGYGLLIHDAYRPWYVTKMFWDATPEGKKIFVANPEDGSRHNRGCAVDLTLYDLTTREVVKMVGGYDEMTDRSFPDYVGGTSLQRWHRDLLRDAMESEGFRVYDKEWWHFDFKSWKQYPVLNLTFDRIERSGGQAGTSVVLLGTGNPNADPDRSGPAVAVIVNGEPYLVDFGPGVVRRASAAFRSGVEALDVTNLTRAFVTHLHSDHTVGYADLIFTPWVLGRSVPLQVYGPKGLRAMTRHLTAAYKEDINIRLKGLEPANSTGYKVEVHEIKPGVIYEDSNVSVTAFYVEHGSWREAFGYKFVTSDKTVVISGDARPSKSIVDQCDGCDILVHEVYSASRFQQRPPEWQTYHSSFHTSTTELARIASEARPSLLILYHQLFWGSPEEELLLEISSQYDGKVVSGRDLEVYE